MTGEMVRTCQRRKIYGLFGNCKRPCFLGIVRYHSCDLPGSALLFMRQAKKAAVEVNLEQGLANKAFKIGLISAIGPACGVFIVMVGLMASIGGPMAWLRLSIIGAAATELSAATMGARQQVLNLAEMDTH